jgi:hypothetical protein
MFVVIIVVLRRSRATLVFRSQPPSLFMSDAVVVIAEERFGGVRLGMNKIVQGGLYISPHDIFSGMKLTSPKRL